MCAPLATTVFLSRHATAINGRRDQLEGKIQERYGIAKDQARNDVDTWLNGLS
jgi:uncharacterized protein YjbJ (UPF0337 family)